MVNITNYQRSTNQNHSEISPHTCQTSHHHKNLQTINAGRKCGEKRTLIHYWCEYKFINWCSNCGNNKVVSQKTINRLPYNLAIPPLGIYSKKTKNKNANLKRDKHPNIHSIIIYNCQDMDNLRCPQEWIKKVIYIYKHTHTQWDTQQ